MLLKLGIGVVVDVLVARGERREVGGEVDQVGILLLSAPVWWSLARQVVVILRVIRSGNGGGGGVAKR